MDREEAISRDPEVLGGPAVCAGTRVPVQTLIDYLKAGDNLDDFLDGFPSVSREQAEAFLQIAEDNAFAEAIREGQQTERREVTNYSVRETVTSPFMTHRACGKTATTYPTSRRYAGSSTSSVQMVYALR
jgi:uncharacterized protein (DUF433 family)